jgi:RHS repeat-associated protein
VRSESIRTGQAVCGVRTVTVSYEYDAFGNSFTVSGSTPNEFMYRGEQYDSDLGLYYLRARYYNPATGRFMSRDPYNGVRNDPASLHKYLYAGGDPVNLLDPTGRAEDDYSLIIGKFTLKVSNRFLEFGGAVSCAFTFDAFVITLLEHGNAIDVTLGGAGLASGCLFAALPYLLIPGV